jgi:hypothetical protein
VSVSKGFKMKTLREAAALALKDLEHFAECGWESDAITALRAALADPTCQESRQVEPFVWYDEDTGQTYTQDWINDGLPVPDKLWPLYGSPPQRKPLTNEEVNKIWESEKAFSDIYAIVRAIELAHCIRGER